MFSCCLRPSSSPIKTDKNYQKKKQIDNLLQNRISKNEILMLKLIFSDLSSRNKDQTISLQNFLSFFSLAGLWGAKLFHMFDRNKTQVINLDEFLIGIANTIKAPFKEKIKLLYTFFEDSSNRNGIKFNQFTKMLYNYSKQDLKQILLQDYDLLDKFVPQINKKRESQQKKIVQLNYQRPNSQLKNITSCFEQIYPQFIDNCDVGTCLELPLNDLTYKIKFCNMTILVQQFARRIYMHNKIDIENGRLTEKQFQLWIESHQKLFWSYFSSFKAQLWTNQAGKPKYMEHIQRSFKGIQRNQNTENIVTVMFVTDCLIIFDPKYPSIPLRVMCLQGLSISPINQNNRYGMEISHRYETYKNVQLFFNSYEEQQIWLQCLSVYQGTNLNNKYVTKQVIGTGKFSVVYRCNEKNTDKNYALKVIQLEKLCQKAIDYIHQESQILKIVRHPQIVKHKETITTKSHYYYIMEYVKGQDLFQYVKKKGFLSEQQSALIIRLIINAVNYLHSLDIVHRDIKPENIMVALNSISAENKDKFDNVNIKIIDFGLSNHVEEVRRMRKEEQKVGTPNYIAPQVLKGQQISFKIDNFAIGAILYFLLSGTEPFSYKNIESTIIRTIQGDYEIENNFWCTKSRQCRDLITNLLEVDPKKRINLNDALNHQWFSEIYEEYCSNIKPKRKLSLFVIDGLNEEDDPLEQELDESNQF